MDRDPDIVAAGRVVPDGMDRIRRYCGREWSGGPGNEVWAWEYYDQVPTPRDNRVGTTDVLAASSLHPGISQSDLTFFVRQADVLAEWLTLLDPDVCLHSADEATLDHVASAAAFEPHVSLTLLTKVLHRKRPRLIPLLDRHVVDWFRPITKERSPSRAWDPLLRAMREDADDDRLSVTSVALREFETATSPDRIGGHARNSLSLIRAVDIAIWMGSR